MNTVNIQDISVTDQVRNLPAELVEEFKELFATGEITMGTILELLQEKGLIAEGVKYQTFYVAMVRVHGFRKKQSHGYLADYQEFMVNWDWAKNEEEGINPEELTLKSNKKAWFLCSAGKHPAEKKIISNHTSGSGCSKCSYEVSIQAMNEARSIPKPGRSLAEMYPLVANEFDAAGNEVSAKDVAARSDKVFTFAPSCGHELHRPYKHKVSDRTRNEDNWKKAGNRGSWCPWCSNEKESELHGGVCEFLSSLIPLESGADVLVNQMVLPDDPKLPEGTRQGNEIDFLSWDLKLAVEIHGHHHKYDPEDYTKSKAQRAEELGLDFFVVWEKDWEIPEKREYLKEQLRVIVGFKVMDYLKKQNRSVSGTFWNGSEQHEAH